MRFVPSRGRLYSHLLGCPAAIGAWQQLRRQHAPLLGDVDLSMEALFFQTQAVGNVRALLVAFLSAVMEVRRLLLHRPALPADVQGLILKVLDCPWVVSHLPTLTRKERRSARARSPSPVRNSVIYSSQGLLLDKEHSTDDQAGWDAARWSLNGALADFARGRLPRGTTSNMAKYHGLLQAFRRAFERRHVDRGVVFETSSMLIARQVQDFGKGKFACRSESLQSLFLPCVSLGRQLSAAGVAWRIRHVYTEYNQFCDTSSREAIIFGNRGWAVL